MLDRQQSGHTIRSQIRQFTAWSLDGCLCLFICRVFPHRRLLPPAHLMQLCGALPSQCMDCAGIAVDATLARGGVRVTLPPQITCLHFMHVCVILGSEADRRDLVHHATLQYTGPSWHVECHLPFPKQYINGYHYATGGESVCLPHTASRL